MMKRLYFLIVVISVIVSCTKDNDDVIIEPPVQDIWTVNKPNQYALNVVFFKPTDVATSEVLLKELSDMMLYIQKWYEKQLDINGFGKKTFGLITNQFNQVKIIVVPGKEPSSYYQGNGNFVKNEVNQYLENHPNDRNSEHTFVLGKSGSGVPFYGLGKMAFATSENFKLTSSGKYLGDLELMSCDKLGGIMHELGHGLNLPHNAHKGSDLPNIALMSYGNHTYEQGKTDQVFLTKSSCAILNVSETFNTIQESYYSDTPTIKIGQFSIQKDAQNEFLKAEGVFTSDIEATHLYIGHNGYPHNGSSNAGYDNVTFTVPVTKTNGQDQYAFNLEMKYADLFNNYKDNEKDRLELTIYAILNNGLKRKIYAYDYTMDLSTKTPNDDVIKDYTPFVLSDRSSWTVTANSTGPGSNPSSMIDGDYSSYWHSAWQYKIATSGSHIITVDMKASKEISGVYLHSDRSGAQYRPKQVEVEVSNDGITWTAQTQTSLDSMSNSREVLINFDEQISATFFRLTIKEVYTGNTQENLILSEVDVF